MRRNVLFFFIATMILILLVASCSDSKKKDVTGPGDFLDPDDFTWAVLFMDNMIMVDPDFELDLRNDVVSLLINGEEVELDYYGYGGYQSWYGYYMFTEGTEYDIKIIINEVSYEESLKMVYRAFDYNFPDTWDATSAAQVSWNLSGNNNKQFATAYSYSWDWENDYEDEYYKDLNPSDRQHTFPANCVQSFGEETEYELIITQLNHKIKDTILFMSTSSIYADYWDDDYSREDLAIKTLRMVRNILK